MTALLAGAGQRLDLLPGLADGAPSAAGFRLAIGGRVIARVEPIGNDQARVTDFRGQARTIALPAATPYSPPAFAVVWPTVAPAPDYSWPMFATLIDGLSLLLTDAATGGALRFGATVRLHTAPGRLGRWKTEIVARRSRLADPALDQRVERLLTAGALPPLVAGEALADVEVVVSGAARPLLTVFVSRPRSEGDDALRSPDDGVLYQETLGLPPAVSESSTARAALAAYQAERQQATSDLLARLNNPQTPSLFGNWQIRTDRTLAEVRRALPGAPDDERETLRFLGAWALVLQRQEREAGDWMTTVAAQSAIPALADEAAFLATTWRWRGAARWSDAPYPTPLSVTGAFAFETRLARGSVGDATAARQAALQQLRAVWAGLSSRPETTLLLHAALQQAADLLTDALAQKSAGEASRLARSLVKPGQPLVDRLLFDAGTRALQRRDAAAASELFRLSMEYAPTSPLAPEAAWRLVLARSLTGDREEVLTFAQAVEEQFGPGAPWDEQRGSTADAAPWAAGLAAVRGANAVRMLALRLRRDAYAQNESGLEYAEQAARRLLDTTADRGNRRADWLALGHLLWRRGKKDEAAVAYANAALTEPDDQTRSVALRGLGACLHPDAARVAAALRDDATLGGYMAPLAR